MLLGGQGSSRDNIVDMGMIVELSAPGVKEAEKAWQVAAHVLFIGSELFDGLGGGFEHGRIGQALVAAQEAPERVWNGEGDHEVVSGKPLFDLFFKPL